MNREDMIALIEAYESIQNLITAVTDLTGGYTIDNERYNGIYNVLEVIRNNSRFPGDDDTSEEQLQAILNAINVTAAEKYELIKVR